MLNTLDVCRNNPAQPEIRVMWNQIILKCVTVLGRTMTVCFATNVGFSHARSHVSHYVSSIYHQYFFCVCVFLFLFFSRTLTAIEK